MVFGQNVVLRHPHKIHIGSNVVIDDNCLLDAKGETNRGIRIGDGVFIGRNTILSCKNGDIELGDGANIGFNCEVFSASRVTDRRERADGRLQLRHRRRPRFLRSVEGGARAVADVGGRRRSATAPGWAPARRSSTASTIGERAVIGAGAVVRESVPASAIAVGIPARVVSTRT